MGENSLLNRHQKSFLRDLRRTSRGLPLEQWPRVVTFRRWMRRPRFKRAMRDIYRTMQFEIDLNLAAAGASAARVLQAMLTGGTLTDPLHAAQNIRDLVNVIRADSTRRHEKRLSARRRARDMAKMEQEIETKNPQGIRAREKRSVRAIAGGQRPREFRDALRPGYRAIRPRRRRSATAPVKGSARTGSGICCR